MSLNRRGAVGVVVALGAVAGCGGSADDAGDATPAPAVSTPDSTVAPLETLAPSTTPEATTTAPPTTAAPTTTAGETTTVAPTLAPNDALPATVWFGTRLLGYFDGDRFVGNPGVDASPAALVGETLDLRDPSGNAASAAVVAGCYDLELDFGSDPEFSLWYTPDAPLVFAGTDTVDGEEQMNADLAALGIDPAHAVSYGNSFTADGTADRLVLVDGWNAPLQWPTWIATWNADTNEFTTVEGDIDPANSLDLGLPAQPWLDTDRDGNLELAFAVGDAYVLQELGSGDTLAVGAAVSC